jgi:hypothetical protein
MKKKELGKRRFKLHWGGGWITEEARSVTMSRVSSSCRSIPERNRCGFAIITTGSFRAAR